MGHYAAEMELITKPKKRTRRRKTLYDRADRFALNNTPGLESMGNESWKIFVEHVRFGYMAGVKAERRRKGKSGDAP